MVYVAENEVFSNDLAVLGTYAPIGPDDADWSYGVGTPTPTTFLITATRLQGNFAGSTITMDEESELNGVPYPP